MDVIMIDSEAYNGIMRKLNLICEYLEQNTRIVRDNDLVISEIWIDTQTLSDELNISTRTLQRMRTSGELPFTFIKHKCCYQVSEICKLIDNKVFNCDIYRMRQFKKKYKSGLGQMMNDLKSK